MCQQQPTFTHQKKQQRARFAQKEHVTVICPHSSKCISEMEHVWCSKADLARFRKNAYVDAKSILSCTTSRISIEEFTKDLSFYECLGSSYKGFGKSSVRSLPQQDCMMGQHQDNTTRGLENLLSKRERLKYRKIARFAVLEVQRRIAKGSSTFKNEKEQSLQIAKIAVKFSRWAREIAFRRGQRDAAVVHCVHTPSSIHNVGCAKRTCCSQPLRIEDGSSPSKRIKQHHDNRILLEVQFPYN